MRFSSSFPKTARFPGASVSSALSRRSVLQRLALGLAGLVLGLAALFAGAPAHAQGAQGAPPQNYSTNELVSKGHSFFGSVSRGLALSIEKAVSQWGQPNGYILGQEGAGAFIGGLRYGEGVLYTRNAGDLKIYWQGPSVGWDFGGDGARTMILVYNMRSVEDIFRRFGGISGSAYLVAGFGMTALGADGIVVVPIRSGVGVRLGANLGYLKFTPSPTWNPF